MSLPPAKMWTEPFRNLHTFVFYAQPSFNSAFATLLQHPCEHSCDWKSIVAGAKAGYYNTPQKIPTLGRLWTLLKQDSKSQPKLACESACAFIRLRATRVKRLLRDSCSGAKALRLPTLRFTCRRHLQYIDFPEWLQYVAVSCAQSWRQIWDANCGTTIHVLHVHVPKKRMPVARSTHLRLQIAHVGRLCRGSKPFSAKDQKDWQAAWFGQHMPNRCHPRKAAACELGLWLSTPAHSKPGGTLGWQCLWLSTLFITLLNLPSVAAQLNPPAFVKNLRCLDSLRIKRWCYKFTYQKVVVFKLVRG